jgi:hypothetical protein
MIPTDVEVFVALDPVSLHKSFDTLAGRGAGADGSLAADGRAVHLLQPAAHRAEGDL